MTSAPGRVRPALVAALALAACITSLHHDFTFDDRWVILDNERVHALGRIPHLPLETYWPARFGGDGYRPVVTTLFTLQWVLGGGRPPLFHAVNIVLAVGVALAVYWCARALLPPAAAALAAALFAVHPVHVEVTGNIVGQSELLVALCVILAVGLHLHGRRDRAPPRRRVLAILTLYAVALFSKEHAVVLPVLIVAAELLFPEGESVRRRLHRARPLLLGLLAVTVAYVYVRGLVRTDLTGFVPYPVFRFLGMDARDRILTMVGEFPRVARLLVFPLHLSAEYSPPNVIVAKGWEPYQIPGLFICAALPFLTWVLRRRQPVVSFGLLWVTVTYLPVSNLLVAAGFVIAERTLFLPSVGVVIVAAAAAEALWRSRPRWRIATVLATGLLVAGGLARSVTRQRVWRDNQALVDSLVRDMPDGYRSHFLRGRHFAERHQLRAMEREYREALRLFPYDAGMTRSIADAYARAGFYEPAAQLFAWTFEVDPRIAAGRYEYVYCLARLGRWRDVRRVALASLAIAPPAEGHLLRAAVRAAGEQLGRQVD